MTDSLELGPVIRQDRTRVLVGTCSWTDKTLTDDTDWYPKRSMSAAERLAFYTARFPVAEADSTYYFPPRPELTKGWVERTPRGLHDERQGVLPLHRPPHEGRVALARHP